MHRRHLLHLVSGLSATAALSAWPAGVRARSAMPDHPLPDHPLPDHPTPPASAREARLLWARLYGDVSGRTVFYFTHGTVWGFKPQADDLTVEDFAKRIYGYSGLAVRKLLPQPGGGFRIHQKFWAFYRDPLSDTITDTLPNPYTGAIDTAAPMTRPDAVSDLNLGPAAHGAMPFDMRVRSVGPQSFIETSSFMRINPGGIPWYKLEATLENFTCRTADLDLPHIPNTLDQNVVAEWQTWTHMHGTPGHILFKGSGLPLHELDAVPADQLLAIERFFPAALKDLREWI